MNPSDAWGRKRRIASAKGAEGQLYDQSMAEADADAGRGTGELRLKEVVEGLPDLGEPS
jgi:hypothetical protein